MSEKNKVLICKGRDLIPQVSKNIISNLLDRGLLPHDNEFGKKVVDAIRDAFTQYLESQAEKKETIQ